MRPLLLGAMLLALVVDRARAQNIVFDDDTIREAVDLWYEDRTAAEAQYGLINDWDTSEVTSFFALFYRGDRENTTNTFNEDIGSWNTSKVTTLRSMFFNATSFNQDISGWDTSNVNTTRTMFYGATSFNSPLEGWDTSNIVIFHGMFGRAESFNQPLNGFDTSSATSMNGMFAGSAYNQPLDLWNTGQVTEFGHLFKNTTFNQPLDTWDTSSARDMTHMFRFNKAFNQPLNNWQTGTVIGMQEMFRDASSFNQALCWNLTGIIGSFNADTARMFCGSQGSFDPACDDIAPEEAREAALNCSSPEPTSLPTTSPAPTPSRGNETLADTLDSDDHFTTLVTLADEAGLLPFLDGPTPLTLFAPTNEAFANLNLSPDTDPNELASILTYHVVNGIIDINEGEVQTIEVATVNGAYVTIIATTTETKVNDANIEDEIPATNGVIYAIDMVLIPPTTATTGPPTTSPASEPTGPPTASTVPGSTGSPTASTLPESTGPPTASTVPESTGPPTASTVPESTGPLTTSTVPESTGPPTASTAPESTGPPTDSSVSEPIEPQTTDRPAPIVSPPPTGNTTSPTNGKEQCRFCPGGSKPKAHPKKHIYTTKDGKHMTCGRLHKIMAMLDKDDVEDGTCAALQTDARKYCCGPQACPLCPGGVKPITPPHKYIFTDKHGEHITCGHLYKQVSSFDKHDVYSGKCDKVQSLASKYCCPHHPYGKYPKGSKSKGSKTAKGSKHSKHGHKPYYGHAKKPRHKPISSHVKRPYDKLPKTKTGKKYLRQPWKGTKGHKKRFWGW